jgi:hypothetical protein
MTAPTQPFVDIATHSQETAATAVRQWADTLPSVTRILTGGRARQADAQTVVDEVFDLAAMIIAGQREITRDSLAVAEAANTAVIDAIRAACRAVAPAPEDKNATMADQTTASR